MSSKNPRVFVARLPQTIQEDELGRLFKKYGTVRSVSLKRGYGFVVRNNFERDLNHPSLISFLHTNKILKIYF